MTSASLNTAEKTLLQHWLADGAPGYNAKVVVNAQNQRNRAPLAASDFAAIAALDNDVVRGYLTSYQVQKVAAIAIGVEQAQASAATYNSQVTALQELSTTIQGVVVQTVPTNPASPSS